jgi:hypothetical protein
VRSLSSPCREAPHYESFSQSWTRAGQFCRGPVRAGQFCRGPVRGIGRHAIAFVRDALFLESEPLEVQREVFGHGRSHLPIFPLLLCPFLVLSILPLLFCLAPGLALERRKYQGSGDSSGFASPLPLLPPALQRVLLLLAKTWCLGGPPLRPAPAAPALHPTPAAAPDRRRFPRLAGSCGGRPAALTGTRPAAHSRRRGRRRLGTARAPALPRCRARAKRAGFGVASASENW